jgi:competence protein ComEC
MPIYDIAFYVALFFILGVVAASLKLNFLIILTAVFLIAVIFLFVSYFFSCKINPRKFYWLAGLSLFIILGAFYYFCWDNYQTKKVNIIFEKEINFQGLVIKNPERGNEQKLIVKLQPPYSGNLLIKLQPYPSFNYGDMINFKGIVKKPMPQSYADCLKKDQILGISNFPKTELIAQNQGSFIKRGLFKLKEKIIVNFQKTLPAEKAAFLAGITLGERSEFSKEFKEAMSNSGTTHLIALSGYNITILVKAVMGLFLYFLSRRRAFFMTILAILGFVLMTGAEASVVRAAIMGTILILAGQVGRVYSFRNAITIAAFLMILFNPRILRFDIGFQLSFLALLGIVYLAPVIREFFHLGEEPGFLYWRENLSATFAAQLMTAPLLISSFGKFSFFSFIPNVLILGLTPLTMALGFLVGFVGFASFYLSLVLVLLLNLLLTYEIFIIKFFGQFSGWQIQHFSWTVGLIYYFLVVAAIFYYQRSLNKKQNKEQSTAEALVNSGV